MVSATNPVYPTYDPNNGYLFFLGENGAVSTVYVWNPQTGEYVGTIPLVGECVFVAGMTLDVQDNLLYVDTPGCDNLTVVRAAAPFPIVGYAFTGTDPYAVGWDNESDQIFAANYISDNVSIIDAWDWVTVGQFAVGVYPYGVAFDPYDGPQGSVLVANLISGNVSVYDVATSTVVGAIPVGNWPGPIAVDPVDHLVIVANTQSDNLTVLNARTLAYDGSSIRVGPGISGINVSATGNVYVTDDASGNVSVIYGSDPAGGIVENLTGVYGVLGAAYDAGDHDEYAANTSSDAFVVIDDATTPPTLVGTSFLGAQPEPVAYSAVHEEYFVGSGTLLFVVNSTTKSVTDVIPLSITPSFLLDVPQLNELWMSGLNSHEQGWLDVLNESNLTVFLKNDTRGFGALAYDSEDNAPFATGTIFLASTNGSIQGIDPADGKAFEYLPMEFLSEFYSELVAGGMVWDAATDDLYLTDGGYNASVTVVQAHNATGKLGYAGQIRTGAIPEGIVLDPDSGLLYVACEGSGNLTVIDPTLPLSSASSAFGGQFASEPTQLAYDPANGYLYVLNPFTVGLTAGNVYVVQPTYFDVVANLSVLVTPTDLVYASVEQNVTVTDTANGSLSFIGEYVPLPPSISVVPARGPVGAIVQLSGAGLYPSAPLPGLDFDGVALTGEDCLSGSLMVNSGGAFGCTLRVPSGTTTSTVTVTDAADNQPTATFKVTVPSLTASPTSGQVGSEVVVSGANFSVFSPLASLVLDGVTISSCDDYGSLTTNGVGSFTCAFSVPTGTSGTTVVATDAGGAQATTSFMVIAQTITVTPGQGPVGATVTVAGQLFTPYYGVDLVFLGATVIGCSSGSLTADGSGDFSCSFVVPSAWSGSTVVATDTTGGKAYGSFTVTTPRITTNPIQGPPGATVTVLGTGFSVSSTLETLSFVDQTIDGCLYGSLTTDSSGSFSCTITVPTYWYGEIVFAEDAGGAYNSTTFYVTTPTLSITPGQGPVGATVKVVGRAFSVDTPLGSLVFDGVTVPQSDCISGGLTTDLSGNFGCTFQVPDVTAGTVIVNGTDTGGSYANASFWVTTPRLTFSPGQGPVGATVTLQGRGFSVDTPLASLVFGGIPVTTCVTGSLTTGIPGPPGGFSCTLVVPVVAPATMTVQATDAGGTYVTTSFWVTAPRLVFSPGQGPVGATVTVQGRGFSVDTPLASLVFDGVPIMTCVAGSLTTGIPGSPGGFSCTLVVPTVAPATVTVQATDAGGAYATTSFWVTSARLILSLGQGPAGATVTVQGRGFSVDTPLASLVFGGVPITTCVTGSLTTGIPGSPGGFSCTLIVPVVAPATVTVQATDAGGTAAAASFIVTSVSLVVTPGQGSVGSMVRVTGHGFSLQSSPTLVFDGVTITSCTSGSLTTGTIAPGGFSCAFPVPAGTSGTVVTAVDVGGQAATGSFVVN